MRTKLEPPKPYAFQQRAARNIVKKFAAGVRRQVLVSPTGSGKSVIAAHVFNQIDPRKAICISDRLGLKEQNEERLCRTVTPQSFLQGYVPDGIEDADFIIWDECHKAVADGYRTVVDCFPKKALWLGLTATPQRSDGRALDVFDDIEVAAHYSELLLNRVLVPCEVDIPESFYDDKEPDLAHAWLDTREPSSRGIIFCKNVRQADDAVKRIGKRAQVYHSGMSGKHNHAALDGLRAGRLEVLATVDCLSEGIDVPEINLMVLGNQCDSLLTYLQRCGRGLRTAPGKTLTRIIDCTGASLRHGSPIEDREYTLTGSGIYRRAGGGQEWPEGREPGERKDIKPYRAKFKTLYGWRNPTDDDKRRQLAWLRQHAARHGYGQDQAEQCFFALFGSYPTGEHEQPRSGKRGSERPPASGGAPSQWGDAA